MVFCHDPPLLFLNIILQVVSNRDLVWIYLALERKEQAMMNTLAWNRMDQPSKH